jgi:beta-phosphoglucomutase-like phosphatase (HAD superfamily)
MNNFKAILFDMDGTLIDSALYWLSAYKNFVSHFNVPYVRDHIKLVDGKSMVQSAQIFKEIHNLPHSVEEILAHKVKTSDPIYTEQSLPVKGVGELMAKIRAAENKKTAIASGAPLDRINIVLNRFGWQNYFNTVVSTDHVGYKGQARSGGFFIRGRSVRCCPGGVRGCGRFRKRPRSRKKMLA